MYKFEHDTITTRTFVKKLAEKYDGLDLAEVKFVSRAAAHELDRSDLELKNSELVDKMMNEF